SRRSRPCRLSELTQWLCGENSARIEHLRAPLPFNCNQLRLAFVPEAPDSVIRDFAKAGALKCLGAIWEQSMKNETPRPIRLKDYKPSSFLIDTVALDVSLDPARTRVKSRLKMRPNPAAGEPSHRLQLDGENLELEEVRLDGVALPKTGYEVTPSSLLLP